MIRALIIFAVFWLGMPFAASAETPNQTVLLTVTGKIENSNRPPFDEFDDVLFGAQDVEFEKAMAFDLPALEAMGMQKRTVTYEDWPTPLTVEGPLLSDVLAAAGAKGTTLAVRALDGYAPEIPVSDTVDFPVILALKVNGKYLGLGGRGPAWVIYPRDDFEALAETDDSKYVWAVYHIEVR